MHTEHNLLVKVHLTLVYFLISSATITECDSQLVSGAGKTIHSARAAGNEMENLMLSITV